MPRRRLMWLTVALLSVAVIAWLLSIAPSWLYHPLGYCTGNTISVRDCKGYNSWSGSFSDISEVSLLLGIITGFLTAHRFLHSHFECHSGVCHRLGFHRVEGTPFRTCWHDHPVLGRHEKHGVPLVHIHAEHCKHQQREGPT